MDTMQMDFPPSKLVGNRPVVGRIGIAMSGVGIICLLILGPSLLTPFVSVFEVVGLLGFYFLPAIIALSAKRRQRFAITALNLLLGWTVIGWIVALVWSFIEEK